MFHCIVLCYNTGLTIANGRLGNDTTGRFTFCSNRGRSVNDYLLLSPENYHLISYFDVLDFSELSDHAPLSFEFDFDNVQPRNVTPTVRKHLKWDVNKTHVFVERIQTQIDSLYELVDNISNIDEMNNAVKEITEILYDNAFKVFGRSILIRDNCVTDRPDNDWFDAACKTARQKFNTVRNFYFRHPSDINRQSYIKERNNYNRTKRKAKINFKRRKGKELCNLAKTEPKKFWSAVRNYKKSTSSKVDNEAMFNHFESILGDNPPNLCEEVLDLINNTNFDVININDLDTEITEEEILRTIKKLKLGKSAGNDGIISEMLTSCQNLLTPVLKKLFNFIFTSGIYPNHWTECLVIAVPKSGDLSNPNNYRPIVLVSVLSKLFTSILTNRLLLWAEEEEKLIANQFGFRPGRSTTDAIFVLHGIICHTLQNKGKLYSAFVDFRKAFDKLDRRILIYKLLKGGISSKFISIVKSVYSSIKMRLRSGDTLSDSFNNLMGVKQGEPLSPLLFLFFINDLIEDINLNNQTDVVNINSFLMYLILFADDTVLFGKSPEILQELLDKLLIYCNKWSIEVNTDKTKIVVFRNGWQPIDNSFFYNDNEIEIVDSYVYLGMLLHKNGKFQHTQKRLCQQGSRALSAMFNSIKDLYLTKKKQVELFDIMVSSVLCYASEIWGFHRGNDIEILHNKFCRRILKVGRTTPNCFLYGELGHLPMYIIRQFRVMKYWSNILKKKQPIVFDIYNVLLEDANNGKVNWVSRVRDLLSNLGLNYIWYQQFDVNFDIPIDTIIARIRDNFIQNWYASIENCEKLIIYKDLKLEFGFEDYLDVSFNSHFLTRLRSGTLKLNIETGRYIDTDRHMRICKCCTMNCVENEYHFLLVCPAYRIFRTHNLPKYYCSWPNTTKLKTLLKSTSVTVIRNLCNFIKSAWSTRSHIVS